MYFLLEVLHLHDAYVYAVCIYNTQLLLRLFKKKKMEQSMHVWPRKHSTLSTGLSINQGTGSTLVTIL